MLDGKDCQNILYVRYLLPRKPYKADYYKETKRNEMKWNEEHYVNIILDQDAHVRCALSQVR